MGKRGAFLLLFAVFAGCAPAKESTEEVLPSSQYRKFVYSTRTSSVSAYCYVEFSLLTTGAQYPTMLESDTLVACNGVRATVSGSGYYANFPHENGDRVRVTVVRPQTGATTVDYYPIQ